MLDQKNTTQQCLAFECQPDVLGAAIIGRRHKLHQTHSLLTIPDAWPKVADMA